MTLEYFTPVTGLVGGALIGLSAAALLLLNGDILGASGLMSSFVVTPKSTLTDPSNQWKLFFVVSFFIVSRVFLWILPSALDDVRTGIDPDIPIVSPLGFILGGFLVGFGTRLGNGCTSGHGICGLARLSIRSMVGVVSFMITGILFASVVPASNPHIRNTPDAMETYAPTTTTSVIVTVIVAIVGISALVGLTRKIPSSDSTEGQLDELTNNRQKILPSIGGAILFAIGLFVSQMTVYSKIFGFLDVRLIAKGSWDPTLVIVMCGGFIVSFVSYQWVNGHNIITNSYALQCPLSQKDTVGKFSVPTNKIIDGKLVLGEAIFGLGWGMAGLCPGPAMVLASAGYPNVLLRWWPMFFIGSFLAEKAKSLLSHYATSTHEVSSSTKNDINDLSKRTLQGRDGHSKDEND